MTLALTGAGVGGMVLVPALVHATQRFGFPAAMAGAGGLGVAFALMAAHPSAAAFVTGSVIRA